MYHNNKWSKSHALYKLTFVMYPNTYIKYNSSTRQAKCVHQMAKKASHIIAGTNIHIITSDVLQFLQATEKAHET